MVINLLQKLNQAKDNQKDLLAISLVILVTLLCFANSLSGEFVFDDYIAIVEHPTVKSISNIPKLFLQGYFGDEKSAGLYRPLTTLSYCLNFAVSGLNPFGYHLINIFIHIVNCCLIYVLAQNYSITRFSALMCALFFAVHPVHSEAVAAIYGRPELLAAMFLFIAWIAYRKSSLTNSKNFSIFWYIFSLVSYLLSLLSKESGIVFVGILFLAQICKENDWKEKLIPSKKLLGYIFVTIPYLAIRVLVTKALGIPKAGQVLGNEPFLTRLYTMSLGYIEYFKLLVWPKKLYTEYDYSIIAKITSLEISVILSLIIIIVIIAIGIWQIKHNPTIAFAILFFFITTSIVSNIFLPTGILIAERTIYLGVGTICLLLATILYKLYTKGWQKLSIIFFIILLSLAITRTYLRNLDFQSDFTLFNSMVELVPNHPKGNYGLGLYYEHTNQFEKAAGYFKKALELSPSSALVHVIIGNFYNKQGKNNLAMPMFKKAIELDPNNAEAHSFYGAGLLAQGNLCEAKLHLRKAISLDKNLEKAHNNLGIVYAQLGFFSQAKEEFERAINLNSEYFQAKENLNLLMEKPNPEAKPINCPEESN
ncbi:MAG: tetratricopeptide repeat protein [Acidobacteria bacterium]|nr:tetratricopeptide repeat protein [Acidobacteriota bacterium]